MTIFDEADKRASAAVDRVLGTTGIRLRPMLPPSGSSYTAGGVPRTDPSRPVIENLTGVLTLRPMMGRADGDRLGGDFVGMFATAEAVISLARSQFPADQLPRRGDRIELQSPIEGMQFFEVGRPAADGSARLVLPLTAVRK